MLVDIACNLTSEQFKEEDYDGIINRSRSSSTIPLFVGVDLKSSLKSLKLASKYNTLCYVGLHPTHSQESASDLHKLGDYVDDPRVAALGECGLDYCRTEFASIAFQKAAFTRQLDLQGSRYFLHSRDSHRDFMDLISDYSFSGVVHSFTGTIEEAQDLIRRGLYIGINGCSLKSEDGVEMVKTLPADRILVETDAPYCTIRKNYAGYKFITPGCGSKRKKNEPSFVNEVLEAVSKIKEREDLEAVVFQNSLDFFGPRLEEIVSVWKSV